MNIWVIIPAYNEMRQSPNAPQPLIETLQRLKEKGISTLVIDDGSVDNTFDMAGQYADIVLKNERNCGKGMALKKAIDYLLTNKVFDYIIFMDADGQHCPSDIDNFIEAARGGGQFIIGNRMRRPLGMPLLRVFTNRFMSWLISKVAGQEILDTQCGFRMVARSVLEKIDIKTNNFEVESEILIKAARSGSIIKSIPVKSIYFKNRNSKINPFLDTMRFFKFIGKLNHQHF